MLRNTHPTPHRRSPPMPAPFVPPRLFTVSEYLALPLTTFKPRHVALNAEEERQLQAEGVPEDFILTIDEMREVVAEADRRAKRRKEKERR